jgi:carbamate kinase
LEEAGDVAVACGGGGIPVAWEGPCLVGVEGVIDKDLASSLLARGLGAQKLIILTSVPAVAIGFGTSNERWIDRIAVRDACSYLATGEFPPGSMGPKMEAAIDFLEAGGQECIITSAENVAAALAGTAGTHIVP